MVGPKIDIAILVVDFNLELATRDDYRDDNRDVISSSDDPLPYEMVHVHIY